MFLFTVQWTIFPVNLWRWDYFKMKIVIEILLPLMCCYGGCNLYFLLVKLFLGGDKKSFNRRHRLLVQKLTPLIWPHKLSKNRKTIPIFICQWALEVIPDILIYHLLLILKLLFFLTLWHIKVRFRYQVKIVKLYQHKFSKTIFITF